MKKSQLMRELLPIIVLLLSVFVVLIVCATFALRGKNEREDAPERSNTVEESVEISEAEETVSDDSSEEKDASLEEVSKEEADEQSEAEEEKAKASEASAEKDSADDTVGESTADSQTTGAVLSSVVPYDAGVYKGKEGKTSETMLSEMMDYWSKNNIQAVEDLIEMPQFKAMSASLKNGGYYYYGERNSAGQPNGGGIAVYAGNQYYCGTFQAGQKHGQGTWIVRYLSASAYTNGLKVNAAITEHLYSGGWANDLPEGEGHEQFQIDLDRTKEGERCLQNVMGNFTQGLYNGDMYILTQDHTGNVQEWRGNAAYGVFDAYEGRDNAKRVPICHGVLDEDNHLWIKPLQNKEMGITELRRLAGMNLTKSEAGRIVGMNL